MGCCCVYCAGEGFCSNVLSIIVSVTFTFHAVGLASPYWMCDGDGCALKGLYYYCNDGLCGKAVPDKPLLTLAVIVLASSLALSIMFCCILHCSHFRFKTMTPGLALGIGGWYSAQEILNTSLLIALAMKYDRLGWSAYVFTVPGIALLAWVICVLVYMLCCPKKSVHPEE